MATIRKHRDKYQVRVRRKDAPELTRSFSKLQDAKEWANHQESRADRGELGPDRKELERITLSELVKRYRDEIVPAKKAAKVERYILNAFLRDPICKKRLSDLTTADFATYRDQRLKGVSSASLKRQLTPLRNMFKVARDEWDVPLRTNPLSGLALKANDNKRERRLQSGEYEALMLALGRTRNPFLSPIIRLAIATAMRRGEILALRLKDIDLSRQTAIIREAKNGYSRVIPLTSEAVTALKQAIALGETASGKPKALAAPSKPLRKGQPRAPESGRLFPVTPSALRELWEGLTKRAGLDDLHFHDLRHEAISRLFELGLTVPEVASISGHRTMSMLMRYAHAQHQTVRAKLFSGPERALVLPEGGSTTIEG